MAHRCRTYRSKVAFDAAGDAIGPYHVASRHRTDSVCLILRRNYEDSTSSPWLPIDQYLHADRSVADVAIKDDFDPREVRITQTLR